MTAVFVGRFAPGSDKWNAARRNGLGGSEIAPVVGVSPFESYFSLWHRKDGGIGPIEETPVIEWGTRVEPVIATKFADEHPDLTVLECGTYRHHDRPWQIANPDRFLVDLAACVCGDEADGEWCCTCDPAELLEIKTSDVHVEGYGEPGTDQVPVHVRCQCMWYLDVFELQRCRVAVLVGGNDYREYVIHYDQAEAEWLRRSGEKFLDTLARRQHPSIDGHDATYQAIKELHPDIDPVDVELDADLARMYVTAREALADATAVEQYARSLVADRMGSAKRARFDGLTVASRQARGDGLPYVVAGRKLPTFPNTRKADAA